MDKVQIKVGDRLYHAIFGWCKVTHPVVNEKALVDLEADEIEYYEMGRYVKFQREKESGRHVLFTPISDLFKSEEDVPKEFGLKKMALKPTLTFWKNGK